MKKEYKKYNEILTKTIEIDLSSDLDSGYICNVDETNYFHFEFHISNVGYLQKIILKPGEEFRLNHYWNITKIRLSHTKDARFSAFFYSFKDVKN